MPGRKSKKQKQSQYLSGLRNHPKPSPLPTDNLYLINHLLMHHSHQMHTRHSQWTWSQMVVLGTNKRILLFLGQIQTSIPWSPSGNDYNGRWTSGNLQNFRSPCLLNQAFRLIQWSVDGPVNWETYGLLVWRALMLPIVFKTHSLKWNWWFNTLKNLWPACLKPHWLSVKLMTSLTEVYLISLLSLITGGLMNLGCYYHLKIPDRLSNRYTYLLPFWQADMLTISWAEIQAIW